MPTEIDQERWQRTVAAAKELGIHPGSLQRLVQYERLPNGSWKRDGRILFFDVEKIKAK